MYSLRNWNHQISEHQGKICITNRLIRVEEWFQSLAFHFGFHQGIISADSYHIRVFESVFVFLIIYKFIYIRSPNWLETWRCTCHRLLFRRYNFKPILRLKRQTNIDPFDFNVINGFINFKFWRFNTPVPSPSIFTTVFLGILLTDITYFHISCFFHYFTYWIKDYHCHKIFKFVIPHKNVNSDLQK